MKRPIDFGYVKPEHKVIHNRLLNWADCYRVGRGYQVSAMFRQYKSTEVWHRSEPARTKDQADAAELQRVFVRLPTQQRLAIGWCYCWRWMYPRQMARKMRITEGQLHDLIHSARESLSDPARIETRPEARLEPLGAFSEID